jgi:hypothetical protein
MSVLLLACAPALCSMARLGMRDVPARPALKYSARIHLAQASVSSWDCTGGLLSNCVSKM